MIVKKIKKILLIILFIVLGIYFIYSQISYFYSSYRVRQEYISRNETLVKGIFPENILFQLNPVTKSIPQEENTGVKTTTIQMKVNNEYFLVIPSLKKTNNGVTETIHNLFFYCHFYEDSNSPGRLNFQVKSQEYNVTFGYAEKPFIIDSLLIIDGNSCDLIPGGGIGPNRDCYSRYVATRYSASSHEVIFSLYVMAPQTSERDFYQLVENPIEFSEHEAVGQVFQFIWQLPNNVKVKPIY